MESYSGTIMKSLSCLLITVIKEAKINIQLKAV